MNKIFVFTLILLISFTSRTTGADDIYDDPSSGYNLYFLYLFMRTEFHSVRHGIHEYEYF